MQASKNLCKFSLPRCSVNWCSKGQSWASLYLPGAFNFLSFLHSGEFLSYRHLFTLQGLKNLQKSFSKKFLEFMANAMSMQRFNPYTFVLIVMMDFYKSIYSMFLYIAIYYTSSSLQLYFPHYVACEAELGQSTPLFL